LNNKPTFELDCSDFPALLFEFEAVGVLTGRPPCLAEELPLLLGVPAPLGAAARWIMTVLLVVLTFAVLLAIDFFSKGKPIEKRAGEASGEAMAPPAMQPTFVAGFEVRENLRYHLGHTWALREGPAAVRVGMDDFAAKLAGRIESIMLPRRGQWIRQGQKLVTVLRDGTKADLVSPIEGEVTDLNEAVLADASLPGRDPYGEGWLVTVFSPDAATNFRNLLGGDLARRWMAEAASRLRARLPSAAGAVAQDGGLAVGDLAAHLPGTAWSELTRELFLI
jgi:glycine cleavage system H lipoate-binding protein